jgi:uncharacterized protein (TIGR02001 family)
MSSRLFATSALLAVLSVPAFAADVPEKKAPAAPAPAAVASPWDAAFGVAVRTDYNFRGISQTDRSPGVTGYVEGRYNDFFYAGVAASSVDLPTSPFAEVDLTAGIRPTLGPVNFDLGGIYYLYPDEKRHFYKNGYFTTKNTDFYEVAGKAAYTWNEKVTVGGNVFYSPSWLNSGADATYISGTLKVALPYDLSASGEFGHYFIGKSNKTLGNFNYPDYNYWNAGLTYTYKAASLDLRYHDTDLKKNKCMALTTDPSGVTTGRSKWCGAAFIATLAIDFTYSGLTK